MESGDVIGTALLLFGTVTQAAPSPQVEAADAPIGPDVVVNAYPPRCKPRAGDPADAASAAAPTQRWYFLVPQPDGSFGYELSRGETVWPAGKPITSAGRWRRAGDAMPSYRFRVPEDGSPICVGRKPGAPAGTVQLQQLLDPAAYQCSFVRLTFFAASRRSRARFWMNGGLGTPVVSTFNGNHGWTPVSIERGPVATWNSIFGFGVIVEDGDLWLYKPMLEIIPDGELTRKDRIHQVECRATRNSLERMQREHPGAVRPRGVDRN